MHQHLPKTAITKSAVQWPIPYLLPARSIHGQRYTLFRDTRDTGMSLKKKEKISQKRSDRQKWPNLCLAISHSPGPLANPFFRHLRFHAFSPSLSSSISFLLLTLQASVGGTFVHHDLAQCLSGSPFPQRNPPFDPPFIGSFSLSDRCRTRPCIINISKYPARRSLFNRRRRRGRGRCDRERRRLRRTVIRSMPSFVRVYDFTVCACSARGRCSDRMLLSMHHVAPTDRSWNQSIRPNDPKRRGIVV